MRFSIFCFLAVIAASTVWAAPTKGLNSKESSKALNLLTRGGVTKVYTDSIVAEVSNLNCNVDRLKSSGGKSNSTTCSGASGPRRLVLSGEKATELYNLLETVTVAQNLPAADSIEVKKMSCRFHRNSGANCTVIK